MTMTMRWMLTAVIGSSGCVVGPGVIGETATLATDADGDGDGDGADATEDGSGSPADGTDGGEPCLDACADDKVRCRTSPSWQRPVGIGRAPDGAVVLAVHDASATTSLVRLGESEDTALALADPRPNPAWFAMGPTGDLALLYRLPAEESLDGYLVEKRDPAGGLTWSRSVAVNEGNPEGPFLSGHDVALDEHGVVYVAGIQLHDNVEPVIPHDEFVHAYDADGELTWEFSETGLGHAHNAVFAPVVDGRVLTWTSTSEGEPVAFHARAIVEGAVHDSYSFPDPATLGGLVTLPVPTAQGWIALRHVEGGFALSRFDGAFSLLDVHYQVPADGPTPNPVGLVPYAGGAIVAIHYHDAPELGLELRAFDAEGDERWTVQRPEYPLGRAHDYAAADDGGVALLGTFGDIDVAPLVCTIAP